MNGLIRWVQQFEQSGLTLVANKVVLGLIRHLLTLGGGFFINQGVMTNNEQETAIAAVITLIGVAWSVLVKMSAKDKTNSVPPVTAILLVMLLFSLACSGCMSSTLGKVRAHDAKVISARVSAQNGQPMAMVGIDWLALTDTGFLATLKADPAGTISAVAWDAAKTAALGAGVYVGGKQAGIWGKDNSPSEPEPPTYQINGNSGTVNISGRDNSSTQTKGAE
jgi:hypothetical protein